jgi:hypothetical protein
VGIKGPCPKLISLLASLTGLEPCHPQFDLPIAGGGGPFKSGESGEDTRFVMLVGYLHDVLPQ